MPGGTDLLRHTLATLEHHFRARREVTFELRDGKLALLSAAALDHPSSVAGLRLAVDLANAGTIERAPRCARSAPSVVQELLHAQLRLTGAEEQLAEGLPASPGAASGLRRPQRAAGSRAGRRRGRHRAGLERDHAR